MEQYLQNLYYNPNRAGGFSGVDAVYRAVNEEGKYKISRNKIRKWLITQDAYTLHKPVRKHINRNRVLVDGIDYEWQADLVDMSSLSEYNNGVKFLLTCLDVFSKYAWVVPLKSKSATSLEKALNSILELGRKPEIFYTDKGSEFKNKLVNKLLERKNVQFITSQNETKASVVERFNRTLKTKMYKYFTWKRNMKYIDVLANFVHSYNNTVHRSIKMKPVNVNERNEKQVWENLYSNKKNKRTNRAKIKFKFQVGDKVRISKTRMTFEKSYLPGWSEEIFKIISRQSSRPPTYRIKDLEDEDIQGRFYELELQKVEKKDDVYRIEKVLRKRKRNDITEVLVKWQGWPNKFNSWIPEKDLL